MSSYLPENGFHVCEQKIAFVKNWELFFCNRSNIYLPIKENTPDDMAHSRFLTLSYFIVLCERALILNDPHEGPLVSH